MAVRKAGGGGLTSVRETVNHWCTRGTHPVNDASRVEVSERFKDWLDDLRMTAMRLSDRPFLLGRRQRTDRLRVGCSGGPAMAGLRAFCDTAYSGRQRAVNWPVDQSRSDHFKKAFYDVRNRARSFPAHPSSWRGLPAERTPD